MGGDIQVIATRDTRPSCATRTWWHWGCRPAGAVQACRLGGAAPMHLAAARGPATNPHPNEDLRLTLSLTRTCD